MIKSMRARELSAVPHLETSTLMQNYRGAVSFSLARPNVIVGPSESGKSVLLHTLAMRFLAHLTGRSRFSLSYLTDEDAWSEERYGRSYEWLAGLRCVTDNAPAIYFRPGLIPGDQSGNLHPGLHVDAEGQAMLKRYLAFLSGADLPEQIDSSGWIYGYGPRELVVGDIEAAYRAETLKKCVIPAHKGLPLLLMDDPEQALDSSLVELLWRRIHAVDCSKMQVIVATKHPYPLLNPQGFNIIETVPGFRERTLKELRAPKVPTPS